MRFPQLKGEAGEGEGSSQEYAINATTIEPWARDGDPKRKGEERKRRQTSEAKEKKGLRTEALEGLSAARRHVAGQDGLQGVEQRLPGTEL